MKYELLSDEIYSIEHPNLKRIRALKDFGAIKAGDLGGLVSDDSVLSQEGDCWIGYGSEVHGGKISRDCRVDDSILINSSISGKTVVSKSTLENCHVNGISIIRDCCLTSVSGNDFDAIGSIAINSAIYGTIQNHSHLMDCHISAEVTVDNSILNNCDAQGLVSIYSSQIADSFIRCGHFEDAYFTKNQFFVASNVGGEDGDLTAYPGFLEGSEVWELLVTRGCFKGTLDQFKEDIQATYSNRKEFRDRYYRLAALAGEMIADRIAPTDGILGKTFEQAFEIFAKQNNLQS